MPYKPYRFNPMFDIIMGFYKAFVAKELRLACVILEFYTYMDSINKQIKKYYNY